MWHIESFFRGSPIYLTAHDSWSKDKINARPFSIRAIAEYYMYRLPIFNRTCYGADAEIVKHAAVVEG